MLTFTILLLVAFAISGALAFVLFWPFTLVHLRDRHPAVLAALGAAPFLSPTGLGWLLARRYRGLDDTSLSGLATPAWLSLLVILGSLATAGVLWVIEQLLR